MKNTSLLSDLDILNEWTESQLECDINTIKNWLEKNTLPTYFHYSHASIRTTYYDINGMPRAVYVNPFFIRENKNEYPILTPRRINASINKKLPLYIIQNGDLEIPYFIKKAAEMYYEIKFI